MDLRSVVDSISVVDSGAQAVISNQPVHPLLQSALSCLIRVS